MSDTAGKAKQQRNEILIARTAQTPRFGKPLPRKKKRSAFSAERFCVAQRMR